MMRRVWFHSSSRLRVVSASTSVAANTPRRWLGTKPSVVWVRSNLGGDAFQVMPSFSNNVDSLERAIKGKKIFLIDAHTIKIFEWDTATNAAKTKAAEPDLALHANTEESPYTFSVPPKTLWVRSDQGDRAFKVAPLSNIVASLKDAIREEKYRSYDADTIKIFEWDIATDTAKTEAVVKQSTPLHANTSKTPYIYSVLPETVWVRSEFGGRAFKIVPTMNDVESLKDAIKEEESLTVKARNIKIFEWDKATKTPKPEPAKPGLALQPNTANTPYIFSI